MKYEQVMEHFKTAYRLRKELGISTSAPSNWRKLGYIPIETQLRIEELTSGLLRASLDDLKPGNIDGGI